jgi:hypothetical protein
MITAAQILAQLETQDWTALAKATTSDGISSVVPQSLEEVAFNTQWDQNSPNELTLLKCIPSVQATKVVHEYARVLSYGNAKGNGFFSETGSANRNTPSTDKKTVNLKLQGEESSTTQLAELQKMVSVMGSGSPAAFQLAATLNLMLRKKARNIYFSDDSKTRSLTAGLRVAGLQQQIREGTDGTSGTGVDGQSHIIDMRGLPLSLINIRNVVAGGIRAFGSINSIFMDALTRADFESSLDGAARLEIPAGLSPMFMGQMVAGVQTNGNRVAFLTDNTLDPSFAQPFYTDELEDGAPITVPIASVAASSDSNSRFDSNPGGAGDFYWVVTPVVGEREGAGVRVPSSGHQAVAVGERARLTITPGASNVESFRIYRGSAPASGDGATTAAQLIGEVRVPSAASVTFDDLNYVRPGLSTAFALRIVSPAVNALANPSAEAYDAAWQRRAAFAQMADAPMNTVALAHLGPQLMTMDLAKLGFVVSRQLLASVYGVEVRDPRKNYVFTNVGRRSY